MVLYHGIETGGHTRGPLIYEIGRSHFTVAVTTNLAGPCSRGLSSQITPFSYEAIIGIGGGSKERALDGLRPVMPGHVESAVALAPETTMAVGVVASQLELLLLEVLHTFQKDLLRLGLLTASGVVLRQLAAMIGTGRLARLEPTVAIGLLTLGLSLAAAVTARLNCVSSTGSFDATCGLLDAGSANEISAPSPSAGFSLISFVRQHPWEVTVAFAVLVAVDRNDVTVRLLDELVHGWTWLSGLLPWLFKSSSQRGSGQSNGARPPAAKKLPPLPPAMLRTLTRRERKQLDTFRRMAREDPFQALRDCLEMLGWAACRALLMRGV